MKALAITEHGNVYSWVHFAKACKAEGVKPIFGLEAYVARRSCMQPMDKLGGNPTDHLVLLARNETGYKNILKLVSLSNEAPRFHHMPRIDLDLLEEHSEGLIAQTACLSGAVQRLGVGWRAYNRKTKQQEEIPPDLEGAIAYAGRLKEIFGPYFFIEIQNHQGENQDDELVEIQHRVITANYKVAVATGVPIVATNDIHFERPEDAAARELAFIIGRGKGNTATPYDISHGGEMYFKSGDEMFRAFPGHETALRNTLWIAEQCNVELEFGVHHFADPIVDGETLTGEALERCWEELIEKGLRDRYGRSPPSEVVERLAFERGVIEKMGFVPYFVMTWDFVNYARENGIPVGPGRGSAGGCLTAYLLNIHDTDTMRYGLLFERFLNPERISMPDFDVDFCKDRVGEVIGYLSRKYGADRVARIATFGNIWAKSAIRETGKILEIPQERIGKLADSVGASAGDYRMELKTAIEDVPLIKALKTSQDPRERKLIELAQGLEGVRRSVSTHACGVVVADRPLTEYTALMAVKKDPIGTLKQVQFDMVSLEEVGLMKIDTLALDTLTILERASQLIRRRDPSWDLDADENLDDPAAWDLVSSGKSMGLFQVETAGMRKLLMRIQPRSLEELSDVCALYRPGPLDMIIDGQTMVDRYVSRKTGQEDPKPPHSLLENTLKQTLGVFVYQEQIMRAAQKLCGWTLARADFLRKAIGKKKKDLIEAQKAEFVPAAMEHSGITESEANDIWQMMETFGRYGFGLAHSTSYAKLSYFTARTKARFPYEFMCASLTSACGWVPPESGLPQRSRNDNKVLKYLDECNRMGIPVEAPNINLSADDFTILRSEDGSTPKALQAGFCMVKGVGEAGKKVIMAREEVGGRFESYRNMIKALVASGVNVKSIGVLILSGCCDDLGERNSLMAALEAEAGSTREEVKKFGASIPDLIQIEAKLPEVMAMADILVQANNLEYLGVYNIDPQSNRIALSTDKLVLMEKAVEIAKQHSGDVPLIGRLYHEKTSIDLYIGRVSNSIVQVLRDAGLTVKEG